MSAYTRCEFVGATATSILPIGGLGKPGSSTCFHVSPPSRVTHTPSFGSCVPLYIAYVCMMTCHMPAKSTFGFLTSIVRPEQPKLPPSPSTSFHVLPPSIVR